MKIKVCKLTWCVELHKSVLVTIHILIEGGGREGERERGRERERERVIIQTLLHDIPHTSRSILT